MGAPVMSTDVRLRLPAYGRAVRDALSSGMRPTQGNTVAVCIDWPERCVLAHVVCLPEERAANEYDFAFLGGVDCIVWFRAHRRRYAEEVRAQLIQVGSPIVAMLCVPEELE
jgi:hypothetical protein